MNPSLRNVVCAAKDASCSFSQCSQYFFNFSKRPAGWAGWENWLTVEIVRRLRSDRVIPFYAYPKGTSSKGKRLDIYVEPPRGLAVEIKVNYLDRGEIERSGKRRTLPDRVATDAQKLERLDNAVGRVLFVSTCFEAAEDLHAYPRLVQEDLDARFRGYRFRWYDCSSTGGSILLLAMSTHGRLP